MDITIFLYSYNWIYKFWSPPLIPMVYREFLNLPLSARQVDFSLNAIFGFWVLHNVVGKNVTFQSDRSNCIWSF